MAEKKFNALPGFGLTMGYTVLYLSLIVMIPMAALFLRVFQFGAGSVAYTEKDFDDLPDFIEQVKAHPDKLTLFVWEKLPEATQQQIASGGATNPTVQTEFIGALNQLVAGGTVFDKERFDGISLSEKAEWYLKHGGHAVWLNRTLLEDAFHSNIKKRTSWLDLWLSVKSERALAAYKLTFGASLIAAFLNAVFGTLLAWVLVRYQFPGRRFIDALVDFPFALPTAVAGLTLSSLFAAKGWLGRYLAQPFEDKREGLEAITQYMPWFGVIVALTFVGMPFVVRTLQPVLENFEREVEEASATLGAGRLRTFLSVIAPSLLPSIITGFALAFARAIGEYGSIVFISSNLPFKSEIAPYLIVMRLEQFDYAGAMTMAVVLLIFSFALLVVINLIEQWASKFVKG
jgi:sulfate transport system permease protein